MYRCGSIYQDHPCEGAQAGKIVRNYGGAAAADQDCKERGARSQKIVWAREAGASAEKQSAEARSADEQKLIAEVYRRCGSAPEVRAAINARDQQQAAAREAESKKRRCDDLKARRAAIVTEQRAAASLSQSEQLNRRQDIDSELSKAGC